jgi:hypothetical protein
MVLALGQHAGENRAKWVWSDNLSKNNT